VIFWTWRPLKALQRVSEFIQNHCCPARFR